MSIFADGRWGQGWNGVGLDEYHTVVGQGVTGFFPVGSFVGDGPGQLIAQLTGVFAIALLAFLIGWLVFLGLNLPYRPRKERVSKPGPEDKLAEEVEEAEGEEFEQVWDVD